MKKMVEKLNNEKSVSADNGSYKNFSAVLKTTSRNVQFAKPKIKNKIVNSSKTTTNVVEAPSKQQLLLNEADSKNKASRVVATIKQRQIDSYDELENYKRLVKKRRKRLIARICTLILLLIVAPMMIFLGTVILDKNSRHDFFGLNFYIVISESMEPEILVNDCVVLNKVTDVYSLKVGDDIGYINDQGSVVVHRIENIITTASGSLEFETGGINNLSSDQKRVGFEQIIGKRVATLSTLGNAVVFFRSVPGIIIFFTMFAAIMVGFYVAFRLSENIRYIENVE